MNKIFLTDKFPYLLTVVLAIIVLQFNYIVDTTFKIPILEYKFENENADSLNMTKVKLIMKNISLDKSIKNLHIQLKYDNNSNARLETPEMDPIPPAARILEDPKYKGDKMLYYKINVIHPGQAYKLTFRTNETSIRPNMNFENNEPIKLSESSFYTFLLRNHLVINFLLMIIFIAVAMFYGFKLTKQKKI